MTGRTHRLPADAAQVVAFAAITATALLAAPAIAAQLASQFHLPPSAIGFYFTVEQGGMCLAALPALWWLGRVPWRQVAGLAMAAFILANLASAQVSHFAWLVPLRAISALSGGTLMVLSMTLAGRSPERERLFALWTLGQLTVGVALLYALPRLFQLFGLQVLYLLIAALMVASTPLLKPLPAHVQAPARPQPGSRTSLWGAAPGLASVLLYYIGYGGIWPFLSAIARAGGSQPLASGEVLALAGLCGIAGALAAALRARQGGWGVLAPGFGAHLLALFLLLQAPALLRFAVGACLLKGASNFTLPFLLGKTARLGSDRRLMGMANMAIGGGLAIGPLITGRLIELSGGYTLPISLSAGLILASALLLLPIGQASPTRPRPADPAADPAQA
ncbi:MAG TPA: MFS transporter [Novosphingobium sp.]|nr:MFS transporter [Novosphingobium sp.]